MRSKKQKLFVGLLGLFIVFILTHAFWLRSMGKWLIYETPTPHSDIIIVLAGDEGPRIQYGVDLYKKGTAPYLMMAGGGTLFNGFFADYMKNYAIYLGAKPTDILVEQKALSTYENATLSLPIIKAHHFKSVLIVTSAYHTRRAYFIFNEVYQPEGIEVHIKAAPDKIDYSNWWKSHEMSEAVLIEWFKLILYKINSIKGW